MRGSAGECVQCRAQLPMSRCEFAHWNALDRCLPGLLQAAYAGGRPLGVAQYAAARSENRIRRAERLVGACSLPGRLSGRKNRHDLTAGMRRWEHWRETGARRSDDALIRLTEFVTQAVDVGMVNPGQAPELLVRDKAHADGRGAAIDTPAVAMTMDTKLRVRA